MSKREKLLAERAKIKQQIWDLEQNLKNKSFVSSVDFASIKWYVASLGNKGMKKSVNCWKPLKPKLLNGVRTETMFGID